MIQDPLPGSSVELTPNPPPAVATESVEAVLRPGGKPIRAEVYLKSIV